MFRPLCLMLLPLLLAAPVRAEVAVSIVPLQGWAEFLLGGEEDVQVLVGPGQNPALFEPTARQMAALADARVFFTIGVPFEAAFVPRLGRMFPDLRIVELGTAIAREDWPGHGGHGPDPHVWLDPALAAELITEMASTLQSIRPEATGAIGERAGALRERFAALDDALRERLAPVRGQAVFTYHPALGYFARAYGLEQVAVERGGTEPGARHLAELVERLEGESLRVLVVEPQFAPQRARALAGSLGLEVLVFDPLAADVATELERFSVALVAAARPVERP
jgi:zinc transport system substrate-binding protein